MERPLLIIGIDPGTTVGYAFLDLTGTVVAKGSARGMDFDALVALARDQGRPVIVGCDKAKVPGLVGSVATAFGARVVAPAEDLRIVEKHDLTGGLATANDHERDALASARFAFERVEHLLERTARVLADTGKESLAPKVHELVLKHGLAIAGAIELLERPAAPEARAVATVVREEEPRQQDVMHLYNELQGTRKTGRLLRARLERLESLVEALQRRLRLAQARGQQAPPAAERALRAREERVVALDRKLHLVEQGRRDALAARERVLGLLLRSKGKTILKRLATLGWDELTRKERSLALAAGDALLVDDPNSHSERSLTRLRTLGITLLVTKQKPGRALKERGFTLVPAKDLRLEEDADVALVDADELARASDPGVLARVLDAYRKERTRL